MSDLYEQFEKDIVGKDKFDNDINSLGQTFPSFVDYVQLCEQRDSNVGNELLPKPTEGLWLPMSELKTKYMNELILIASPKLVDLDSNPEGVSTAHWQDDEGWVANGWDMNKDKYVKMLLSEEDVTHFMNVKGPYSKDQNKDVDGD